MKRFSEYSRVFFLEEPVFEQSGKPFMEVKVDSQNLWIVTPHLIHGYGPDENVFQQKILISSFYNEYSINTYTHWYYTPMALIVSNHLKPEMVIYDCMDELSNFKFAPPELSLKEKELFRTADLVFTGGHNLYQAKKKAHNNIFPFPSSIDREHFQQARIITKEPADQARLSHPIFGFYGVIDERFDIDLLGEVARRRPEWTFVIIGPVIKIDSETLPQLTNINYLGARSYDMLPYYLSGWDIAMIPFVLNDSTKYISPTKTPEYLAAGVPVISSSIVDVVNPYAINNLVHIADDADTFIEKAEKELSVADKSKWLKRVDLFLKDNSWDKTWEDMMHHMNATLKSKKAPVITTRKEGAYV